MNSLPGAAAFAVREVLLVVATHLRREPGNVVAPTRQNLAYYWIDTLTHTSIKAGLARLPTARPVQPGCAAKSDVAPTRLWPLPAQVQDGCFARRYAPALYKMRFHHSRREKNPRGRGWTGALHDS